MTFPSWYIELISQNQTVWGILITAGLSYLLYMHLLRINNFFDFAKEFSKKTKGRILIRSVYVKKGAIYFKTSHNQITQEDYISVMDVLDSIIQLGIMYRMGLIHKELVFWHFEVILRGLKKENTDLIEFVEEGNIEEISVLIKKVEGRWNKKRKLHFLKKRLIPFLK